MRYNILFILLAILAGCKKSKFTNMDIYGHAGNGLNIENSIYKNNTSEAIKFALETEGVKGVEVDVQLSADGDLWLFHDDQLNAETEGNGCISDKSFDELNALHYKSVHKEKLVRLKDLPFDTYGNKSFLIDARHYRGCDYSPINYQLFVQELKSIVLANPNCEFIVLSKYNGWVSEFKNENFQVFCEINALNDFYKLNDIGLNCDGVIVKNSNCSKSDVEIIHGNNKKVFIFEVRAPKSIKEALKKGANGIITDDIRATLIEKG